MTISHLLANFNDSADGIEPVTMMTEVALEDHRLAAFEQGYSAGWEDSVKAQKADQRRVTSALAGNLEDLSFTYHDALSQMLSAIRPVFQALVETALPRMLHESFGAHLVDQLCDLATGQASGPIELTIPAGMTEAVSAILPEGLAVPIHLREDTSLDQGCAYLLIGESEKALDTGTLLDGLQTAIKACLHLIDNQERRHGT